MVANVRIFSIVCRDTRFVGDQCVFFGAASSENMRCPSRMNGIHFTRMPSDPWQINCTFPKNCDRKNKKRIEIFMPKKK